MELHNHRSIGGHKITDPDFQRTEYQYILDGQQRTTSLLTSLYGGKIDNRQGFDPTVYVDLTVSSDGETDDVSYKDRFLFWDEIDDRGGELQANIGKKRRMDEGLIVKLIDIKQKHGDVERHLVQHSDSNYLDFDHPVREELRKLKSILDNYRISFIEVRGIQVGEVCQIFERINQAGKPLTIFDIVVAKTFRPRTETQASFYLRELIDDFRNSNQSLFLEIGYLDYLQTLAVLINRNVPGASVRNITDRYLNEIKTDDIIQVWDKAKDSILKTFDFFENHLHIKTHYFIPFRYFYFTIAAYFYDNKEPDYDCLKLYFWYYSFHNEDLLTNATHLFQHCDLLQSQRNTRSYSFPRFLIDKNRLRTASYSSRGRWSRAILCLFSSEQPRDWKYCDREVMVQNLFLSTDKPNLHHIFPTNSDYVVSHRHENKVDSNSLMNIAYITQITNINITNRDPLEYLKDYDKPGFENILKGHFLPREILDWARAKHMPDNALDIFIDKRVEMIIEALKKRIPLQDFAVIDSALA